MYVFVGAAIFVAFISAFAPRADLAEDRVNIHVSGDPSLRLRYEVTPKNVLSFENVMSQEYDYSCGSAALATLLNYSLGEELSEKQVIRGMLKHGDKEQIKKRQAFSLLDMKRLCTVLGYESAGYRAEMDDLRNPEYWPCLLPIQFFGYRHFVVFKGIHDNHVFLADPFRGNISYTLEDFRDAWYENVIFIVSEATRTNSDINLLKLTKDDLCYISDDIVWDLLKNIERPFDPPVRFQQDEVKGEYQIYRP